MKLCPELGPPQEPMKSNLEAAVIPREARNLFLCLAETDSSGRNHRPSE
jgi:hypothetical protein